MLSGSPRVFPESWAITAMARMNASAIYNEGNEVPWAIDFQITYLNFGILDMAQPPKHHPSRQSKTSSPCAIRAPAGQPPWNARITKPRPQGHFKKENKPCALFVVLPHTPV